MTEVPELGLRERRRMRTMGEIQQAALRLFVAQGYDATTVEQIAAAAGVSPATFFRYFPAKEDVLRSDEFDAMVLRGLADRPPEEGPYEAVRATMRAALPYIEQARESVLERVQLLVGTPALRARLWDAFQANVDNLAAGLAPRLGRDPADLETRAVAGAVAAAGFAAVLDWAGSDGRADLGELFDRALDALATARPAPAERR